MIKKIEIECAYCGKTHIYSIDIKPFSEEPTKAVEVVEDDREDQNNGQD